MNKHKKILLWMVLVLMVTVVFPNASVTNVKAEPVIPRESRDVTTVTASAPPTSVPEDYIVKDNVLIKYLGNDASILIPDSVTSIGDMAFSSRQLYQIWIPSSVVSISNMAFYGAYCPGGIYVDPGNMHYSDIDGVLYNKDQTILIKFTGSTGPDYVIPDGVTSIGDGAFYAAGLNSVEIPEGVTSIGNFAFQSCWNVYFRNIHLPDSVTSIGTSAFQGCLQLETVNIPDSVTYMGDSVFRGCAAMRNIDLPDSLTKISAFMFANCSGLDNFTIPDSITEIDESAFHGCSGLKNIHIPDNVTRIGDTAFASCGSLKSVSIPDSVTYMGDTVFSGCDDMTTISLPEGLTKIGASMFAYCYDLESITIPDSINEIDESAFNSCGRLENIQIPDNVTRIGEAAFAGCSSLESLNIPESVVSIGVDTFASCAKLTLSCFSNSYAHQYAMEHDLKFELYEDVIVLSEDNTGVIISADRRVIPSGATLQVTQINEGELFELIQRSFHGIANTFRLFDINLLLEGEIIKPNGMITICIPIPIEYNDCQVYGVDEHGVKTVMPFVDQNGYFEIETVDLGLYAVSDQVTVSYRKKGDVDGDGEITLADAQLALRGALNIIGLSEEETWAADVNGDGLIKLNDAQTILRAALNIIEITCL